MSFIKPLTAALIAVLTVPALTPQVAHAEEEPETEGEEVCGPPTYLEWFHEQYQFCFELLESEPCTLTPIYVADTIPLPPMCIPEEFVGASTSCTTAGGGAAGWWGFDEEDGLTAYDSSAYANHGQWSDDTVNAGPAAVDGFVDGALTFHNFGSWVDVADSSVLDGNSWDFSASMWIQTLDRSGVAVILDKRKPSWPYTGYHAFIYNGYLALQLGNSGGYSNYISNVFVADGQLHHIAVTVDRDHAQGIRWYLDGVEAGTPKNPTGRTGSLYNTEPLRLGARSGTPSGYLNGLLDEFQLYRKVLSSTDVAALYAAGSFGRCDRP